MSDCGCKKNVNNANKDKIDKLAFTDSIFMRIFLFALSLTIVMISLVPIIIPMIIIMLWNRIVRKKDTNFNNGLLKIGKLLKTSKKRKEDDDDYENITDENKDHTDYELVDVDIIK